MPAQLGRSLGRLRAIVAKMLNRTVDEFLINDEDLLNIAINNARRFAESLHDFEESKILVDLVIDEVAGGALDDCYVHGGDVDNDPVEVKTIIRIGQWDSNNFDIIPKKWLTYDEMHARVDADIGWEYDPEVRYPSDSTPTDIRSNPTYFIRGGRVFLTTPGTSGTEQTIGLYVARFFPLVPDNTEEEYYDYSDFLLRTGFTFLQWQTIIELNHINKHFVYRQEGNVQPPEKMAAAAWEAWTTLDNYQFNKVSEGHL